jgi:hypothetical protein
LGLVSVTTNFPGTICKKAKPGSFGDASERKSPAPLITAPSTLPIAQLTIAATRKRIENNFFMIWIVKKG